MTSPRMNLIMLVIDTARRDRFGCYGYPRGTTPAIDALARESLVFDRMITTATWTIPSHGSLFTGLYPREHRADYPIPIMRDDVPTLASHLAQHGYSTAVLSNNPLIAARTRLANGFQVLKHRRDFTRSSVLKRRVVRLFGRTDKGAKAANRLFPHLVKTLDRPFFLYMNYMECHWPYGAPASFEKRFVRHRGGMLGRLFNRGMRSFWDPLDAFVTSDDSRRDLINNLYDAALACTDDRAGELLELLQALRLEGDTVVVVTSDHGESMGEDGLGGHQGALHQGLIHVPFIVRVPGWTPRRVGGLFQFTDVFAGLSRLLGVPVLESLAARPFAADLFGDSQTGRPYAFAQWNRWGANMLPGLQRRYARIDFTRFPAVLESVQDGRFKLVTADGNGALRLHDLQRDPKETSDCASAFPDEVARLRGVLERWRSVITENERADYTAADEAAVERRLRSLGYL